MMRKKLTLFFLGLLSLISFSGFIKADDPFTELLKKLELFARKYPQEKVYLHLDKPYYAIGDDIWFKAYVVDGKTTEPSNISNILYVELINEKDSIQKQLKLPMQAGITWGDFQLADSLNEGNYRIRAYTQWMRNAGPEFFFDKTIKVGNSWVNKVFTRTNSQFQTEDKGERLSTNILFQDKEGKPFANRNVNYLVQLGNTTVLKGKSTTNQKGEIDLSVLNAEPKINQSGKITATITMPDGTKVVKNIPIKATSTGVNVQFFPEGGNLVEGLPSRIAVKAINTNGLGEDVSGTILDDQGNEILNFETTYLGMGSLFFTPETGRSYIAKVNAKNAPKQVIPLPQAQKSGYALAINNTDSAKMSIRVMLTADLVDKGELNLVAQHNGNVYFTAKIPTETQTPSVIVPKVDFPSGLVQVTLFSPTQIPVAERIVFVNNTFDKISLTVKEPKPIYTKRENVSLDLLSTKDELPIQGSFSVSVTNASIATPDPENESNILTSLLLTSDLVGFVEKPNHYFLDNSIATKKALDNLLLTQGWRKVGWKKLNEPSPSNSTFSVENTMSISGTIKKGGKQMPNAKVILMSGANGFIPMDTLTTADGRFAFKDLSFVEGTKFVIQARTEKNNDNVKIELDSIPGQVVTRNINTGDIEVNVNERIIEYLQQSKAYFDEQYKKGFLTMKNLLKEIVITGKRNVVPDYSANLNGPGNADYIVTAKELQNSMSLKNFIAGRFPGILVRGSYAYAHNTPPSGKGLGAMKIAWNGTILDDFMLDDVIISDIETIEILTHKAAIYGGRGATGLILITTKRGKNNYDMFAYGIITHTPKGYYMAREFYSPKYDVNPDSKPDLRTTVYWNPNMVSNAEGKLNFNYFNTDQAGTYRVVIEGIDELGNLARKTFTYQVN